MTYINTLSHEEILATALFYADSGVYWLFESPAEEKHESKTINLSHEQSSQINHTPNPEKTAHNLVDHPIVKQSYLISKHARSLIELKSSLSSFHDCILQSTASSTICADQDDGQELMIIGYTPSDSDHINGKPFTGKIGDMLNKMLKSIGIMRKNTCISMISPWNPMGNRKLSELEKQICRPIILKQIELVYPKIILLLGNETANFFFSNDKSVYHNFGKWKQITINNNTIPTLSTVHPKEMIEYPLVKKIAWRDLLTLKDALNISNKKNMST
ncbi:MAG: uracil-DNA glycosylase [Candidatus Liberibacter europaeus]|uniref:Uracil-DNA glycosylase n=1 Tax=Candidatus Liberibacter europaeus TaxID=744859 RepID=A0A2T4VZ72_9HYPH|nr:uracil-DNA glycosylase [Candidatus Liberibacter europaeus]PTL87063.1 MAG: uracil-DNA glycosylase [Candidatus Liberibacter europaeus]